MTRQRFLTKRQYVERVHAWRDPQPGRFPWLRVFRGKGLFNPNLHCVGSYTYNKNTSDHVPDVMQYLLWQVSQLCAWFTISVRLAMPVLVQYRLPPSTNFTESDEYRTYCDSNYLLSATPACYSTWSLMWLFTGRRTKSMDWHRFVYCIGAIWWTQQLKWKNVKTVASTYNWTWLLANGCVIA